MKRIRNSKTVEDERVIYRLERWAPKRREWVGVERMFTQWDRQNRRIVALDLRLARRDLRFLVDNPAYDPQNPGPWLEARRAMWRAIAAANLLPPEG